MKLRLFLLAILLAAAAFVAVRSLPHFRNQARLTSTESAPPIEAYTPVANDTSLKFSVLREHMFAPYRLRPDRRCLLAITQIRRLAGVPDSAIVAQYAGDRWHVTCGNQELGTLSELPDFPEMIDLLTECARKQAWARGWSNNAGPERPALAGALDRLDAPSALRAADHDWAGGARDAALFRHASRAYALLALETPPGDQTSDAIVARSLATLAYARALGAEDPKREACLVADVMGYSAAATELAGELSARDPLRLYATWDDAGLERAATAVLAAPEAANGPPKNLEAPFFHLLRLASRGDYEAWFSLMSKLVQPGVPSDLLFSTGLQNPRPEPSHLVAEQLLQSLDAPRKVKGRKSAPKPSPANLAQQIERVETALAQQPRFKGGPIFDADLALAQERAILYSALDKMAASALDRLSPAEMSRWFAGNPKKSKVGRRAAAFQRWYAHLAQAHEGRPGIAALRADVDSLAPSPAAALRSFEALRPYLAADDAGLRAVARGLARQMDSRPDDQAALASIAEHDLMAFSLSDRLDSSLAAVQGAADEPAAAPPAAGSSAPESAALAKLLAAHPSVWAMAQPYASWLEDHQNYDAARRVIERWMSRSPADSNSPAGIDARIQLARLHQLGGHPELGLRAMGDLYRSGYFPAVERTALVQQDLGQKNQALALAWAAHRQNPQLAAGRALVAELFWLQGQYGEAAKALHDGRPELNGTAWAREIAPRFVAVFRDHPGDGLMAADAMIQSGFNQRATIGALPEALGADGQHDLAFQIQSRIRPSGAQGVESALLAYGYLRVAKGEAAALTWIRGRVPEKDREVLSILAYQEHHPELLWSMPPMRTDGEHGDYRWLLRAAACMAAGPSHPHYAETVNHVDHAKGTYHIRIAKYLLGLGEESEIHALALSPRQRSEIYYFIGLKSEQRGRNRDAGDWYLMSVEAGGLNNIESRWAMQRLRAWAADGRPADRTAPPQAPSEAPPA